MRVAGRGTGSGSVPGRAGEDDGLLPRGAQTPESWSCVSTLVAPPLWGCPVGRTAVSYMGRVKLFFCSVFNNSRNLVKCELEENEGEDEDVHLRAPEGESGTDGRAGRERCGHGEPEGAALAGGCVLVVPRTAGRGRGRGRDPFPTSWPRGAGLVCAGPWPPWKPASRCWKRQTDVNVPALCG